MGLSDVGGRTVQAISTLSADSRSSAAAGMTPLRFLFTVWCVILRSDAIILPYMLDAAEESLAPGGSSMNGMNLSGNPGIVQPMQIPPTFGQPPMPAIQPRFGTLQFTTGPQQPMRPGIPACHIPWRIGLARSSRPVATFMHRLAEQPFRPQLVVERNHRGQARPLDKANRAASP